MNGLDLVLAAVVMLFAALGAFRGLIREVFSLAAWVLGGLAAWALSAPVTGLLANSISEPAMQRVAAFALVFGVIFVLVTVSGFFVRKLLFEGKLKTPDHVLGAFIGAVRGVAIIVIVVLIAGVTPFPKTAWWRGSYLMGYFQDLALWVLSFVPPDVARYFTYG